MLIEISLKNYLEIIYIPKILEVEYNKLPSLDKLCFYILRDILSKINAK